MLRTGEDYRESIRDGRTVFINRERVEDVASHPAFKPIVDPRARIYDMAHEERYRDIMSYAVDGGNARDRTGDKLPRSRDDWHTERRAVNAVYSNFDFSGPLEFVQKSAQLSDKVIGPNCQAKWTKP